MRLLDLFCGAGGAGMGYHRAGFEVVGVDINPQPHYPFEFHQADALEYLAKYGHEFDAIHASPPCQRFSQAVTKENRLKHPDYIKQLFNLLDDSIPHIIENVKKAPIKANLMLCGSMFGLRIKRHRYFHTSPFSTVLTPVCNHYLFPQDLPCAWNRTNGLRIYSISGGYQHNVELEEHKKAMGIDWNINYRELSEAIPPAYTEFIGKILMERMRLCI